MQNQKGTLTGYTVEARCPGKTPVTVDGTVIDNRWRRVELRESPHGVPRGNTWDWPLLFMNDMLGYKAAKALMWWFLADADYKYGACWVEARIVSHRINYDVSTERIGEEDTISSAAPQWQPAGRETE